MRGSERERDGEREVEERGRWEGERKVDEGEEMSEGEKRIMEGEEVRGREKDRRMGREGERERKG